MITPRNVLRGLLVALVFLVLALGLIWQSAFTTIAEPPQEVPALRGTQ
jgi:hypothetical protein